jgi:hypothetical protein
MKSTFLFSLLAVFIFISCQQPAKNEQATTSTPASNITGTWKLLTGTLIENGDTTVTDYTKDKSFIKIITPTHFAFLTHTLRKDTTDFSAGGGRCIINGNNYSELLDYCNAKEWEGHRFDFTVTVSGDTLVQTGVEKIEAQHINRLNTERYVRQKE